MTIDEYTKKNNLPKMKFMGEMKNFRYYIVADIPSENEVGIPDVIAENKTTGKFTMCDSEQASNLAGYFYGETK